MVLTLYSIAPSPPCRAVLMVAKHLNLDVNVKTVDLLKGEHLAPEYLKINPQHTVPTLDDSGFILPESRAIMAYLVNKYSPGHSLYPSDPHKRATIDRWLNFDIGTLTPAQRDVHRPMLFGLMPIDPEKEKVYKEKLELLETLMGDNKYLTGESMTLADISVLAILTMTEVISYDLSAFKKITRWMNRVKAELPCYSEVNDGALQWFKSWYEEKLQEKRQKEKK